jgi:outer membrane protein OmpA-like peptidoglycan-associated protein
MRLTTSARAWLAALVVGATGITLYSNPKLLGRVAPDATARTPKSNIPPVAELPGERAAIPAAVNTEPGCAGKPEVRFYHWAWNAQMGLMLATGGPRAATGSLMCKHGVNLTLVREDNADQMQAQMAAFAEALKRGEAEPKAGAHFVAIMGDGSAQFLKGLNDRLAALGPDYTAAVVGSAGYSRGEDKLMGPPAWRDDPQAARGGLVAGVLRDGDWNIALKWLGDNKVPNNPDETTYDPDALNWVGASDYVDAAQKYVNGHCVELKNVKTGHKEKRCVDAVVTWTPGDVAVAEQKGGLVSIVSTKEYRAQMPNVIIGNRRWMNAHRETVKGLLQAIFEAGEEIKKDDGALRRAAAVSAVVYKEKDAGYWYKYFTTQKVQDKKGLDVELGGSSVNNLADNAQLFGLAPGSIDAFAATYTVFGNVVRSQYPALLPSFAPAEQVTDTSYLKELLATTAPTKPDVPRFDATEKVKQVIGRRAWDIRFAPGSATFTPEAKTMLASLRDELVVAGGALVEIHGHTDSDGGADSNMRLSEQRAFAAKRWLEEQAPSAFPEGRIRVFAHGQTEPVESNATLAGRAKNRRVVVVIGTPGA